MRKLGSAKSWGFVWRLLKAPDSMRQLQSAILYKSFTEKRCAMPQSLLLFFGTVLEVAEDLCSEVGPRVSASTLKPYKLLCQ